MRSSSIAISSDDSDEELRSLARWLRDEDEFRGRVELLAAPIAADEMGADLESVVTIVTSGTAGVFVTSLFAWLERRRSASRVRLTIRTGTGATVELTCGSAEDADAVLKQITKIIDE
ncbi:effector-associated constant component EACC1 [Umezawaea tangerina]|uniref:Uncharacterized protein n=1 Tax=Umezawaea tangerina TaxID=84725 RepID=A0A2T0TAS6_9PSEU|nr:hypothetical protein [Umezawaea tangerina]PRY42739.1 hypothetical protein CLV43_104574 [Umezawaea tangerina]